MALIVEDGTGKDDAESYAAIAEIDAYWANRAHRTESATWTAASTANKESVAREATQYIDGVYGSRFRGHRSGQGQTLEWPRIEAEDAQGYPLPDLPKQLKDAVAELAVRALSAVLDVDQVRGGRVKRNKVDGAVEQEFFEDAPSGTEYKIVIGILGPILSSGRWAWA